jgi:hypothetical protein
MKILCWDCFSFTLDRNRPFRIRTCKEEEEEEDGDGMGM